MNKLTCLVVATLEKTDSDPSVFATQHQQEHPLWMQGGSASTLSLKSEIYIWMTTEQISINPILCTFSICA